MEHSQSGISLTSERDIEKPAWSWSEAFTKRFEQEAKAEALCGFGGFVLAVSSQYTAGKCAMLLGHCPRLPGKWQWQTVFYCHGNETALSGKKSETVVFFIIILYVKTVFVGHMTAVSHPTTIYWVQTLTIHNLAQLLISYLCKFNVLTYYVLYET